MPTRLVDMEIDEVSLVDNPAEPNSKVVLYKRDETGDVDISGTERYDSVEKEVDMSEPFDIDSLPEEARAYVNKLEDHVIDLQEKVEALSKAADEPEDDDKMAEILKAASDEVRELVEKAQAEAEAAQELAKAEREARLKREYLAKAQEFSHVPTSAEELGDLLKMLNTLDPESAGKVESLFKAMDEEIAKGALFSEFGSALSKGATSAEDKLNELAKSISSSEGITREQAFAKALDQEPELYTEYLRETQGVR